MKRLLPLLLILAATPALAHQGAPGHTHSIAAGLLHPLTGADHLLAMLAAGLAASAFRGWKALALAAGFLAAMGAGFLLALNGTTLPAVETGILLSVIVLGGLSVFSPSLTLATLVASGFAVFHGYAHGAEIGNASGLAFGAGFLAMSAGLLGTGMVAGHVVRRASPLAVKFIGALLALAGLSLVAA